MFQISKNILFNIFLISFLVGIFLQNSFGNIIFEIYFFGFLFIFFFFIFLFFGKLKKYIVLLVILFLAGVSGIYYSDFSVSKINNNLSLIKQYNNKNVQITGEIVDLYKVKDFENIFEMELQKIGEKNFKKIKGLIKVPKNYNLKSGDIIKFKSKFQIIEDFNDFSYKKFMLSKGIYFKTNIYFLENIGHKDINKIVYYIGEVRAKLLSIIYEIYPKNEGIFLGGILLGARENLPKQLQSNFNNSGLTHLIAVSGFNITILIIFFGMLFKYFPIYLKTILIVLIIGLFTILVGFTAPVIRASLMGSIAFIFLSMGRKTDNLTLLLFVAFLMIIESVYIINFDVSFALSFLAVLGILYTQDFWNKVFNKIPNIFSIKEAFVLTMAALSFTLPIMLLNFGQFSIVAPITNVAVIWTIPIAMGLGFISILLYFLSPFLAYIIGFITWIFLKWDIWIVNTFGTWQYSTISFDFGNFKNIFEILYFMVLIFCIIYFGDNKEEKINILE